MMRKTHTSKIVLHRRILGRDRVAPFLKRDVCDRHKLGIAILNRLTHTLAVFGYSGCPEEWACRIIIRSVCRLVSVSDRSSQHYGQFPTAQADILDLASRHVEEDFRTLTTYKNGSQQGRGSSIVIRKIRLAMAEAYSLTATRVKAAGNYCCLLQQECCCSISSWRTLSFSDAGEATNSNLPGRLMHSQWLRQLMHKYSTTPMSISIARTGSRAPSHLAHCNGSLFLADLISVRSLYGLITFAPLAAQMVTDFSHVKRGYCAKNQGKKLVPEALRRCI
jgi:hypothetical protein